MPERRVDPLQFDGRLIVDGDVSNTAAESRSTTFLAHTCGPEENWFEVRLLTPAPLLADGCVVEVTGTLRRDPSASRQRQNTWLVDASNVALVEQRSDDLDPDVMPQGSATHATIQAILVAESNPYERWHVFQGRHGDEHFVVQIPHAPAYRELCDRLREYLHIGSAVMVKGDIGTVPDSKEQAPSLSSGVPDRCCQSTLISATEVQLADRT